MVDGIDTMVLMGLYEFSNKSVAHVARMKFNEAPKVQFFETVIRYVGGLLSAYALTGEAVFLARADDLGQALLPIFDSPVSLPFFRIDLRTGKGENGWMGDVAILAEMASCQMEYRYLAHLTGRLEYIEHADYITSFLRQHEEREGLFALTFAMTDGQPRGDTFSVGARADSAYEYLLKQWLMTGKTEQHLLDMYLRSASAIIENMLYVSPRRKLLYVTDINRFSLAPVGDFQHLSCFIAGVFALGVAMIPNVDARHAWVAEGLAHTCWITYADSVTGLAPEVVIFRDDNVGRKWVDELRDWENRGKVGTPPGVRDASPVTSGQNTEYELSDKHWLLRPETIESFYILWRTTGDKKWRERGWAIFEAIEKHARVADTYTSLRDVSQTPPLLNDELPSFFFAETLKYAYLLFIKEDIVPLDKWTFNTEAHPFPVFTWSAWEKEDFHIN
ncbi:glycoside hydrolase family 47 protein [Phlebiopsis gigantea 11061_1 CR5-6]|uniref:alpha-1,2-Mannosidase n=1 Tax=Phlebiopsis gigantea (strain 11061_1 CR5-6) TaxID=745531 RepID=A0A0C3SDX8_PHLG1|nr:glycoside hydrolase family 47 protein [Phlebiopsis gigantea 11061_1 CR5-6]